MVVEDEGVELSALAEFQLDPASVRRLGYGFARRKQVVVLGVVDPEADDPISVGMVDATDANLVRHLGDFLQRAITPVRLSAYDIAKALDQGYGRWHESSVESDISWRPPPGVDADPEHPMQRVLDELLKTAIQVSATAIHVENTGGRVRARLRVDGALRVVPVALQADTVGAFLTRVCALAGIERDGPGPRRASLPARWQQGGTLRSIEGIADIGPDDLLLRLRPPADAVIPLQALGFDESQFALVRAMLEDPHGLVVFAGPRGSGCSSTLRASLDVLGANEATRVVAVERTASPSVPDVVHRHARDDSEMATLIRNAARRDADVIAAGALPDASAAGAIVNAAQAGHLALAVLGASEPGAAIARLRALGIDDAVLADALLGVIAQRLVRRICPHCVEPAPSGPLEQAAFTRVGRTFAHQRGHGCSRCAQTGFCGRLALFEILAVDPETAHLIATSAPTHQLRANARERGMTSMLDAGLLHVEAGQTTLDEVRRAVPVRLLAEG